VASEDSIRAPHSPGRSINERPLAPADDPLAQVVRRFLASPHAITYAGFWVALDSNATVVDRDLSPTALSRRVEDRPGTVVTFVASSEA